MSYLRDKARAELARVKEWNRGHDVICIPRYVTPNPVDDPVRVRLEWRMGLVKLKLQHEKGGSTSGT